MAELLRTLEVTINRRLDGVLHGNHQGLTPGHGSEPGEARLYQAGDDVRRIDWNVTARTQQTHIRELIADRDLEAWLVVDASPRCASGPTTTRRLRSRWRLLPRSASSPLATRTGSARSSSPDPICTPVPPRGGRTQVMAILSKIAAPAPSEGRGRADLAGAIDRVGALSRRRGFVAVIADFVGSAWVDPLARLGLRHDLLAITVSDPRELDIPPIGLVEMVDPATGVAREVRVTPSVQRRFAALASKRGEERRSGLRRAGCELIELSTGDDWLGAIVSHVHRRRRQAVRGDTLRR